MAFDFFGLFCDLKNCKFCGVIPTVSWLAVGGVDYFFAECSCAHKNNPFGRICERGYKTETLESREAVIKDWNEKQSSGAGMAEIESKTSDIEQLRKLLKDGRHERITHALLAHCILELADRLTFRTNPSQFDYDTAVMKRRTHQDF